MWNWFPLAQSKTSEQPMSREARIHRFQGQAQVISNQRGGDTLKLNKRPPGFIEASNEARTINRVQAAGGNPVPQTASSPSSSW